MLHRRARRHLGVHRRPGAIRDVGVRPHVGASCVVGAAVMVAVVTSCGGGEPVEAGPPAPAIDWRAEVNATCAALGELEPSGQRPPADIEEAQELAASVASYTTALRDELRALRSRGDVRVPAAIAQAADELAAAGEELHRSTLEADPDAAESAVAGLQRLGERLNALATRFDVPDCGGF